MIDKITLSDAELSSSQRDIVEEYVAQEVKEALANDTLTFFCEDCDKQNIVSQAHWTKEQIAESGTPVCECDRDMVIGVN